MAKVAFLIGVLLSGLAAWQVQRNNDEQVRQALQVELQETTQAVFARISLYSYGLYGLRGALQTVGIDAFNETLFQRYSQTRSLQREFPGARAYGVIRRVTEQQAPALVQQMRDAGRPDFMISQFTPRAGDRFVIQYMDPLQSNVRALGVDIASEPSRRRAAEEAMRSGEPMLTAPIALVQDGGEQQSFLMLLPFYDSVTLPATPAERERRLLGWTFAPLNMGEVLENLGIHTSGLGLRIYDHQVNGDDVPFFRDRRASASSGELRVMEQENLDLFGRQWRVEVDGYQLFIDNLNLFSPYTALLIGVLLTTLLCALVSMLQVTNQRRQEIASEQAKLAAIVESSSDGIIGKDLTGVVTSWNRGAEHIFGHTAEQALGSRLATLIVPSTMQDQEFDILRRVGRGERVPHFETQRLHRDGHIVDVSVAVSPIHDADGRVIGASKTVRDISVQRAAQASIQALYADLERQVEQRTAELTQAKQLADGANAAKSSFLANMSHEIRTPLNAILGMLQLIRQTPLNFRQNDYASKAQSAARSLLALLNDILDFSKIEAGKLVLEQHPFELEKLMRELGDVLTGNQGDKVIEVIFDLDPNLPSVLFGDSLRLQQVLINLAGNALKFTLQGHVIVSVKALGRAESTVTLRISVTDTGIGINDDQLERIFEGFAQAEASTTRRFGGTGLGLVICKRLVQLMGSQLQVASEVGRGSRFWFDIEFGVRRHSPLKASCPAVGRDLRVLVADDNAVAGELLGSTIVSLGWRVDRVSNGRQAVDRVFQSSRDGQPYDVVLMDWRMPELDGLAAAGVIHESVELANQPVIIMVTAFGREMLDDDKSRRDPRQVNFLTKPLTPQQLANAVQRALDGKSDIAVVPCVYAPTRRRLEGLHLLVVEDNELNRQVAAELLGLEGASVVLAEGGLQGVEQTLTASPPFDVVIMDVQMPDIDGLEATRRIRAHAGFSSLPILAMTANASPSDRALCLKAGMNEHVGKPIDINQVVDMLLRLTAHYRLEHPTIGEEEVVAQESSAVEAPDSIRNRFGGNLHLFQRLLKTFRVDALRHLSELERLLEHPDAAAILVVLHTLKGSAGSMGARALYLRVRELEAQVRDPDHPQMFEAAQLDELKALTDQCSDQLSAWVEDCLDEKPPPGLTAWAMTPRQWHDELERILPLLESRNMRAVEWSDELLGDVGSCWDRRFLSLVEQIQTLEFEKAADTVRQLLAEADQ
jgi:PAS domain S-box-containing protein